MTPPPAPRPARRVRAEWERLAGRGRPTETFEPATVADLPEAARRWLLHAIAPGTPLWPSVVLSTRGQIWLGAWRLDCSRRVRTDIPPWLQTREPDEVLPVRVTPLQATSDASADRVMRPA